MSAHQCIGPPQAAVYICLLLLRADVPPVRLLTEQLDPDRGPHRIPSICCAINDTQQFSDQLDTVGCPDHGTEQLDPQPDEEEGDDDAEDDAVDDAVDDAAENEPPIRRRDPSLWDPCPHRQQERGVSNNDTAHGDGVDDARRRCDRGGREGFPQFAGFGLFG